MNSKFFAILLLQLPLLALAQTQIGIGTSTPQAPLDLGNIPGNRMIFWGEGSQTHYGIGSQNGNMQIYANLSVDNIGFGLGRSVAFGENLRIKGNGMVGIYNNNPAYKLDINGRIKLSGFDTLVQTVDGQGRKIEVIAKKPNKMLFNNSNNSAPVASIGASVFKDFTGFYAKTGFFFGIHSSNNILRLGMLQSTQIDEGTTYSLAINGSAGTSGQILRSRGLNGAAGWTNTVLTEIHNGLINAYGSNDNLTNQLKLISLEKMEYIGGVETDPYDNTYDLKTPSKLLVKIRVSADNSAGGCELCGASIFDIVLADNGTAVRTYRFSIPQETSYIHETATALLDLPAGIHQLKLGGYMVSGPTVSIGNLIAVLINTYTTDGLRMSVEVIPSFK